jgi:hypothetical protein
MDPITALSIAGNVVQFISFGSDLFSKGREIYKSTTGTLSTYEQLELLTTDLRSLVIKLRQRVDSSTSEQSISYHGHDHEQQTAFENICDDATVASETGFPSCPVAGNFYVALDQGSRPKLPVYG